MLKKMTLSLAAIAALAISTPHIAQAATGIEVTNDTAKYVWVSLFNANAVTHTGCLKPHENKLFHWADGAEVKIRAEIRQSDCRGSSIADISARQRNLDAHKGVLKAVVGDNAGKFGLIILP